MRWSIFESLDPSPEVEALIVRARAITAASRSDPGYVRHLFDQFSADYDDRMLGQLNYAAPRILNELADLVMAGRDGLAVVDLGCGTGLAGMMFRSRAARLDGVDLSPAMIEKARARGIYDSLAVADIESGTRAAATISSSPPIRWSIWAISRPCSAPWRIICWQAGFSSSPPRPRTVRGFELGPKRRWRHSESYLRERAKEAGLSVAGLVTASPRSESHQPVPGFAVALKLL